VQGVTSKTAIFNKAIVLLGSRENLLSPDEAIPSAQSLTALWDIARKSALALHPWNFAVTRAKLTRDTKAPEFGYAYQFKRPKDCLRWLPWDSDDPWHFDGEEEGEFFLTDEPEIFIRFIIDHNDSTKWPPLFVDVLAYTLAAEYCEAKTGLRGLRQSLIEDRENLLRAARKADGLASGNRNRRRRVGSSRWAGSRFRNGVLGR
jgi:hypothetical protein